MSMSKLDTNDEIVGMDPPEIQQEDGEEEPVEATNKRKRRYDNLPITNIERPHLTHDIVCGRGGGKNRHPGNILFREMVGEHRLEYRMSRKLDKPKIPTKLVRQWRNQEPPGRFLKMNESTKLYDDVGDAKAIKKTKQLLREGASKLCTEQEQPPRDESAVDEDRKMPPPSNRARFSKGPIVQQYSRVTQSPFSRDHESDADVNRAITPSQSGGSDSLASSEHSASSYARLPIWAVPSTRAMSARKGSRYGTPSPAGACALITPSQSAEVSSGVRDDADSASLTSSQDLSEILVPDLSHASSAESGVSGGRHTLRPRLSSRAAKTDGRNPAHAPMPKMDRMSGESAFELNESDSEPITVKKPESLRGCCDLSHVVDEVFTDEVLKEIDPTMIHYFVNEWGHSIKEAFRVVEQPGV